MKINQFEQMVKSSTENFTFGGGTTDEWFFVKEGNEVSISIHKNTGGLKFIFTQNHGFPNSIEVFRFINQKEVLIKEYLSGEPNTDIDIKELHVGVGKFLQKIYGY